MNDDVFSFPKQYQQILDDTKSMGFNQLSDGKAGSLLSSLCTSKVRGGFLELGTGTGLCTSWMLQGMCESSTLTTVDNDKQLVDIAKKHLNNDQRVNFVVGNGEDLIDSLEPLSMDLIFADTWPGKYNHLEETLSLLKIGGFYIIDDMLPQDNWPDGHEVKSINLINALSSRADLTITKMSWSTGLLVCVKNA